MESRNPVLRQAVQEATGQTGKDTSGFAYDEGKAALNAAAAGGAVAGSSAEALQQMYASPSATSADTGRMTLNDVIVKTGMCFVLLMAGAVIGWSTAASRPYIWIMAMFIGLGLGLVNSFKKQVSPLIVLLYAFAEGVFLGGISQWYNAYAASRGYEQNLALQAVIGTMVAFGVMLALYSSRIIKVNGRFAKMMTVAMVSYLAIALVSLVASLFGVGGGWGFYGIGTLGILLCMFGVALASFSLCLDFESIVQAVRYGAPERESWRMAFGLLATLIWLYLEILRTLAILAGNNR